MASNLIARRCGTHMSKEKYELSPDSDSARPEARWSAQSQWVQEEPLGSPAALSRRSGANGANSAKITKWHKWHKWCLWCSKCSQVSRPRQALASTKGLRDSKLDVPDRWLILPRISIGGMIQLENRLRGITPLLDCTLIFAPHLLAFPLVFTPARGPGCGNQNFSPGGSYQTRQNSVR